MSREKRAVFPGGQKPNQSRAHLQEPGATGTKASAAKKDISRSFRFTLRSPSSLGRGDMKNGSGRSQVVLTSRTEKKGYNKQQLGEEEARESFTSPALPPFTPALGLSAESEGRGGRLSERREKLFQKCPVTPCKVLCLDWRTMPTGAAFPDPPPSSQPARLEKDAKEHPKDHGTKSGTVFSETCTHYSIFPEWFFFPPVCATFTNVLAEKTSKQKQHKTLCSRHQARQQGRGRGPQ